MKYQKDYKFILNFEGKDLEYTPATLKELFSRIEFA